MQGASDVIATAGAALVGGHTIDDDAMKFGLAVTGYVHPDQVWTNAGAKEGDTLILTKGLGTGTLTAALKRGMVSEKDIEVAIHSMCQLNNIVHLLDNETRAAINASTDVTGFGLAGHGRQLAEASGVLLEIESSRLPLLPGTQKFLEKEILTKAHRSNLNYTDAITDWRSGTDWQKLLAYDPQTSGGLLLAVKTAKVDSVLSAISKDFPATTVIGRVCAPVNGTYLRFI